MNKSDYKYPLRNSGEKINWLGMAERVNSVLGSDHSGNYCYQIYSGRQSSETVKNTMIEILKQEPTI